MANAWLVSPLNRSGRKRRHWRTIVSSKGSHTIDVALGAVLDPNEVILCVVME